MNTSRSFPAGRRRTVAAVLAVTAALGGAGAVTAVAVADDGARDGTRAGASRTTEHPRRADDSPSAARRTAVPGGVISLTRAADAGMASQPGTVTAVELDEHRDGTVWEVEIVAARGVRHEVSVNPADGTVTGSRPDGNDDRGEAALARSARTGLAAAVRTALARVPGSATSVEIDGDGGRAGVWQVSVAGADGAAHEVSVATGSGKVTAVPAEDVHHHRHGADDGPTHRSAHDAGARHATPEDRSGRHTDEDAPSHHEANDDGPLYGRGRGSDDS